jgi:hypothetical protein
LLGIAARGFLAGCLRIRTNSRFSDGPAACRLRRISKSAAVSPLDDLAIASGDRRRRERGWPHRGIPEPVAGAAPAGGGDCCAKTATPATVTPARRGERRDVANPDEDARPPPTLEDRTEPAVLACRFSHRVHSPTV